MAKKETKTYRNNGAVHVLLDGTMIKRGETFTSDDPDLLTKFPNKFELLPTAPAPEVKPVPKDEGGDEGGGDDITQPLDEGTDDVTEDFPAAKDGGLTVVRDEAGWWVCDDSTRINAKALLKKNVDAEIKAYLGD